MKKSLLFLILFSFLSCSNTVCPEKIEFTLEEKISQMLILGFKGSSPYFSDARRIVRFLKNQEIGGVIFFRRNFKNSSSVRRLMQAMTQAETSVPAFFMLDQEGGLVQRLNSENGYFDYPPAGWVSSHFDLQQSYSLYSDMARNLADLGINVNLSPCVDLNVNPDSPAIGRYYRSFSDDTKTVYEYAETVLSAHETWGVLSCLKHFPGHGSALTDSHNGFTDVSGTWTNEELLPFAELISNHPAEVKMVMAAHVFNTNLDANYPASLSEETLTGILRDELGFQGLILSDDLQMGAISENYGKDEAVILAIQAGCDLLLVCDLQETGNRNYPEHFREIVLQAIQQGKLSEDRINESFERIMQVKSLLW